MTKFKPGDRVRGINHDSLLRLCGTVTQTATQGDFKTKGYPFGGKQSYWVECDDKTFAVPTTRDAEAEGPRELGFAVVWEEYLELIRSSLNDQTMDEATSRWEKFFGVH